MKESIKLESFNALEVDEVIKYLEDNHLDEIFEVADAKREYYQNKYDTLVLRLKDSNERLSLNFDQGVALGQFPGKTGADEFSKIVEDYRTYYRIWWD